jgi:glycosyltransferase involved in cell wall biosynthesis
LSKVSICIPQYNRCDALRLVLDDLLSQTFKDFTLIVVDDASRENTDQVIHEYKDPRIRYFKNIRNVGLFPNFNQCIQLAEGEYVAIYHNHDRYANDIVEKSVRLKERC